MSRKTPAFPAYPSWTTARFWAFLRSALRRAWTRWPPKYSTLNKAKHKKPAKKAGRHVYEYRCAACAKLYPAKEVSVDHIKPVGSLNSPSDLPSFVENLFCGEDNLQVLCKSCHDKKTKEDRKKQ